MTLNKFLTIAIALFSLAAASFWLWSSLIDIRPNQDTFVSALKQASLFSSYAAGSAGRRPLAGIKRGNAPLASFVHLMMAQNF